MRNDFIKKTMALMLAIGIFSGGGNIVYANELIDPLVKDYIPKIKSGEILPPQYENGGSPDKKDWIKSVKKQGEISRFDGAVKWKRIQKEFKIKKEDQNGNPIEGVTFKVYNTKKDAETEWNPIDKDLSIGLATSDKSGIVDFGNLSLYYQFYIKETKVPDGYTKSGEIIPVYRDNGVRFLGEIASEDMKVTSINQGGKERIFKPKMNLNLCQALTYLAQVTPCFGGMNWLLYNDNGTEKLVSKQPLGNDISWNTLYNEGLVFGMDGVKDANFEHENYYKDLPKIQDRNPNHYKPTYITINNRKYIIRLMRTYNEKTGINDNRDWEEFESHHFSAVKGSEWNRLIIPLIDPVKGRDNSNFVERNMPVLANYSWRTDFNTNGYYGIYRWTQETSYDGNGYRTLRGDDLNLWLTNRVWSFNPNSYDRNIGWQPVLERVE